MMRALAEIGAMTYRAALGAGIPVGQAEDLGRTAIYMAGRDQPLDPVVAALEEAPVAIEVARGGDQFLIRAGTAAMTGPMVKDCFATGGTRVRLADAAHAPLVQAMLAEIGIVSRADGPVIYHEGHLAPGNRVGPVEVPDDIWDRLSAFAAKTLVQDSTQSRETGAGAGLTDND